MHLKYFVWENIALDFNYNEQFCESIVHTYNTWFLFYVLNRAVV